MGSIGVPILPLTSPTQLFNKLSETWKTNSKFTIHPFKALHSRHLLPLSIPDYVARFSLELVVLSIAIFAVAVNFSLVRHAESAVSADRSVIFSFLKNHPSLNAPLVASADTTTVMARADQQVGSVFSQSAIGIALAAEKPSTQTSGTTTIQAGVAMKTNPADTQGFNRIGLAKYSVQPGDTIVNVAASFGISPETIMMENKLSSASTIKPGQELTILPTTGITYTIKETDTLEALTEKYKISEDDFLDANNVELFEDLAAGTNVVIPLASVTLPQAPKPVSKFVRTDTGKVALRQASAPANLASSPIAFVWPTPVRNITQGFSGRHNGLDISNSKMESIYASADGFVEISGYQSNGYGNTVVINHGNGFKTRYAHASALYVSAGDYVSKGQAIAKQGRTGRVRGATGIHLHFEIMKNGGRVNPLNYVRP